MLSGQLDSDERGDEWDELLVRPVAGYPARPHRAEQLSRPHANRRVHGLHLDSLAPEASE